MLTLSYYLIDRFVMKRKSSDKTGTVVVKLHSVQLTLKEIIVTGHGILVVGLIVFVGVVVLARSLTEAPQWNVFPYRYNLRT